jgi:hypothetical protein
MVLLDIDTSGKSYRRPEFQEVMTCPAIYCRIVRHDVELEWLLGRCGAFQSDFVFLFAVSRTMPSAEGAILL